MNFVVHIVSHNVRHKILNEEAQYRQQITSILSEGAPDQSIILSLYIVFTTNSTLEMLIFMFQYFICNKQTKFQLKYCTDSNYIRISERVTYALF